MNLYGVHRVNGVPEARYYPPGYDPSRATRNTFDQEEAARLRRLEMIEAACQKADRKAGGRR